MRKTAIRMGTALLAVSLLSGCATLRSALKKAAPTPTPTTCARQLDAWKHAGGPAALQQVETATQNARADDSHAPTVTIADDLTRLGVLGSRMDGINLPACADPAHYWESIPSLLLSTAREAPAVLSRQAHMRSLTKNQLLIVYNSILQLRVEIAAAV